MVPITLVNPMWLLARRLLQLATGLATTAMVLALGPAGGQPVAAAPSLTIALPPAAVTVAHLSDAAPASETAERCGPFDASIADRYSPPASRTHVHSGQSRRWVAARSPAPERATNDDPYAKALGQRAPPAP